MAAAALALSSADAAPVALVATKDAPDFDLRTLVDWSAPLSLSDVVDAVERVLQHPSATQARTAPVVRDILK
jgi:hypothetical protein